MKAAVVDLKLPMFTASSRTCFFFLFFFFTGQRPPVWFCVSCTCMAMVLVGMSNSAGGMGDITVLVSILMDKALSEA